MNYKNISKILLLTIVILNIGLFIRTFINFSLYYSKKHFLIQEEKRIKNDIKLIDDLTIKSEEIKSLNEKIIVLNDTKESLNNLKNDLEKEISNYQGQINKYNS